MHIGKGKCDHVKKCAYWKGKMCLRKEMCIKEGVNVSTLGYVHIGGGKSVYGRKSSYIGGGECVYVRKCA